MKVQATSEISIVYFSIEKFSKIVSPLQTLSAEAQLKPSLFMFVQN